MKVKEAVVEVVLIVLLAFAAGYRIGAHSVPALQVTVQAPPAPMVGYWPSAECVVFTNGDLEVTGKGAIGTMGDGNVVVTGKE